MRALKKVKKITGIAVFLIVLNMSASYALKVPVLEDNKEKERIEKELKEKERARIEKRLQEQEEEIQKQAIEYEREREEEKRLRMQMEEEFKMINEGQKDGVRIIAFNKFTSNKIAVREAMTTSVVFEGEVIEKIIVGDESAFFVEQVEENIFIIFAQEIRRDTSITVITENKDVYPFIVKSLEYNTRESPDIVVKVRKNNMGEFKRAKGENGLNERRSKTNKEYIKEDYLKEVELDPNKIDWDYKMKGDNSIKPKKVWNDGYFTYIEFEEKDSATLAYKVLEKVDTPISASKWEGNVLVVKTLGDITLRSGKKYVCIRPQSKELKSKRDDIKWLPFI